MFNNYALTEIQNGLQSKKDLRKSYFDKTRFTNFEYVIADNKD
jgi:hypothetical protein